MNDFEFLIISLRADAEMQLGMHPTGDESFKPQLPLARKLIDTLVMLQDKTKGNLSIEEQRMLDNTVTELRFRYIQAFETQQKAAGEASANG